jgi:NADH-quinone oxidoreductase subunit N
MIVTALFAIVPKLSFLVVFIKLYSFVFVKIYFFISNFLFPLGILSIFVGIIMSLYTTKIKRLLAYSAITHAGYIVTALSLNSISSLDVAFIYILTYVISSINIFAILLTFRKNISFYKIRNITELSVMLKANPFMSLIFSFSLLSSAGIPPLAGFFGKFLVFQTLMEADAFYLAGLVILSSVVSSIYYIRLIRFIFFNNPNIESVIFPINIS